ncbi:PAS domain S-box protein [Rhodohalobacter sp. SW132]|uniref:PAS domain S-box protein n=1 Tax=Rhodohalobacter sp. SW132 TaxID=2293433 RepID=UPI000E220DF4|nr:PAS domain S-box protein [Rhodohalobacter sp. SW132]REL37902.1 PAS domain S-box protein [Rhodohalobacter sp. SW132]
MKIKNTNFLFAENPNPMWIFDPTDLTIKEVNDAACVLYGYSKEEFLGLTIADLRPEDEVPRLMKEVSKRIDSFSNAGIWTHRKKCGELFYVRVHSHPISMEGKKFKLVVAYDVTNKIQYREELEMLLDNSLDGIMLTSPEGSIYRANNAACQILGMSEEEVIGLGRDGLVDKDEKLQKALQRREKTGEFSGELTFIHSSGQKIPVELTSSVFKNLQGQSRTSIIFRDITQRKQTEQKLKDVIDHSTNLFYRHDVNHVLTYVSQQSEEFLGCSPEKAIQNWSEFITEHPVNKKGIKHTQKAIETGETQPPFELQLKKITGEKIWVQVHEAPIVEDGKTVAIVGSLTDITRQKKYENQLQESLERYHYASKATNDAIYEWDIKNDQHHFGEGFKEIFGHNTVKESISLKEYTDFVHPDDHPSALKSLNKALKDPSQEHWRHEYRFENSIGEYAHVIENAHIIRNNEGVAVRMIGAIRDVTKQKELEQLLDQAYSVGRIGVWELDLKNNNVFWSTITKELHEVEPDYEPELETAINFYKEGKNRALIQEAVSYAIEKGVPWDEELLIITAKGNERWVRAKGEPEVIEGQCRRIYGIFQDIHERKEAHLNMLDALQERQRILERITEAFFAVNKEWTVTYWNHQAEKMLGLTRTDALGNNLWKLFPEAKKLGFFQQYKKALEQQIPVNFEEYYPPLNAWFEVHGYPSKDGLSVFFRDITSRKNNQIELKQAYKEKETILESIDDGFFAVNRDWIVTYWNNAAERKLETPRDMILGQNLWEVFDDAIDLPSYTNYHRVMNKRISIDFEDYYAPLDRWYDISAYPSKEGISVYFKDITQHKKSEAQLRESLKEKETLLAEIHHRVKNNLAVVSSLMMLQSFQEDDESLKEKLNDSVSRIKTIGNIHELLYKSESFSKLNLDENIKKLVDDIALTYQPVSSININFNVQKIELNINQAIPVSLIVNEVVTNMFKHAFVGKEKGNIWISLSEKNETIYLVLSDDGIGLPVDLNISKNPNSLGMQLIDTLAQQLEGEFKYETTDGKTNFKLTFTKKEVKGSGSNLM